MAQRLWAAVRALEGPGCGPEIRSVDRWRWAVWEG